MTLIAHTRRRPASFVFRRKVPKYYRGRLGMTEIVRSLKTNSPVLAKLRSAQLWIATERYFQMADTKDRDAPPSTKISPEDLDRFLAHVTDTFERDDTAQQKTPVDGRRDKARALAAEVGLHVAKDSPDLQALCHLIEDVVARRGAAVTEPARGHLRRGDALFSTIWKEYERHQVDARLWQKAVARQNSISARLFTEICEDKTLSQYSPADGAAFRRVLLSLPADYSKNPRYRDIYLKHGPTRVAEETADQDDLKRLSPQTCNRHLAAFSGFWEFAKRHSCVHEHAPSIFDGLHVAIPKRSYAPMSPFETRPIWSDRFMRTMFEAPLFQGCQARNAWRKPGPFVFRDERYWAILLGPHQGLRREELFQLRVANVKCDPSTKVWYVDLFSPDLRLKTTASARRVPLHENIIKLGFIEARVNGRPSNAFLFPEAKPSTVDGKRGDNFGKFFTHFRTDIADKLRRKSSGAEDEEFRYDQMVYHGARHTFATLLYRTGASIAYCEEMLGHQSADRKSEFFRYNKGMTLDALKSLIDQIIIPIDIAAHIAAIQRAEAIDRSTVWPVLD